MNIYTILTSINHNKHYVSRYIKYITKYSNSNSNSSEVIEKHHILPKSLFPEYENLRKNSWNMAKLTPRQHFIAHKILCKVYPETTIIYAYWRMVHCNKYEFKITSKHYDRLKKDFLENQKSIMKEYFINNGHPKGMLGKRHSIETKRLLSSKQSGENNPMFGKSRPDLALRNKNEELSKEIGIKRSLYCLNQKLQRFNLSKEELSNKILQVIKDNPEYINKLGRNPGTINFNKVAKHFDGYGKGVTPALQRFYHQYMNYLIEEE